MVISPTGSPSRPSIGARYRAVRQLTEKLCQPLEVEDYQLQSMPDCSPPKWHLAHTTWFFETFVLSEYEPGFRPFHPQFCYLFNSYYHSIGERWARPMRGLLSRPTVREVFAYRAAIDERVLRLLERTEGEQAIESLVELGLNHEEQHQELLLTDLKHGFALNPLLPVYSPVEPELGVSDEATPLAWHAIEEGVRRVGFEGAGFAFDNESPRHRVWLEGFRISSRPVTCGEYLAFIEDNGYDRPELWLSDGWTSRLIKEWTAPLYWKRSPGGWSQFTLGGDRPLELASPVCHLSYYEADAYARWADARLPTEHEWEVAVEATKARELLGNFLDSGRLHPAADPGHGQYFGDVWEWTGSPYNAYPGFKPASGGLGEYNGKFMCNQMVLRGGSCATPAGHVRPTYRNFFPPDARWQFSGFRLARDLR
jgi:ergothioneine biosynthesis protein EgtB